jgi:hypothetical protein
MWHIVVATKRVSGWPVMSYKAGWGGSFPQLVQMTTKLCGLCVGGCDVADALLDEETLSAVVTAFELSFSCALFHVAVSDDGNDYNMRLFLVVTCNPITSSGTPPQSCESPACPYKRNLCLCVCVCVC